TRMNEALIGFAFAPADSVRSCSVPPLADVPTWRSADICAPAPCQLFVNSGREPLFLHRGPSYMRDLPGKRRWFPATNWRREWRRRRLVDSKNHDLRITI